MNPLSSPAGTSAASHAPADQAAGAAAADVGNDVLNRRERKKRETRDALETAALRLFAEKGYDETTVEEIAEAADVAVRTFFRYFQSKQHVLFGDVAHDVTGRLRAALDAQPAALAPVVAVGAALELLGLDSDDERRQILDRMRLLEKLPELAGTYHMIFQDLHDVIADYTADRIGAMPKDLHPQLLASAATGSIKAALLVFENAPDGRPISEVRAEAYDLMTTGLHDVVR
jgi:AcrR family transcriptional regulator